MSKGKYVDEKLLKKIKNWKEGDPQIKTYSRNSTITKEFVGHTIGIHNGKDFISVYIRPEMIGHKLGEFAPTRKFIKHGGQKEGVVRRDGS
ncbi:MAG: 30S ribosomal protein S19 [candidate division WOR-3 bacterium]